MKKEGGGIKLQTFNLAMTVLACLAAIMLGLTTYRANVAYKRMQDNVDAYIMCEHSADSMKAGSDYLTREVRLFAVNGDPENVENFFTEINVTRSREKALEVIREEFGGSDAYYALENALEHSNELIRQEYYSMRLVIEARGYDLGDFPEELRKTELSKADEALSDAEKLSLAVEKVFGDEYQEYKDSINESVARCLETLSSEIQDEREQSSNELFRLMRQQMMLIVLFVAVVMTMVLLTTFLVVRPLRRCVFRISDNEMLPENGSYELRYLAKTYNRMFEKTRTHQEKLSYEATHDPLTSLYNRGVFEETRHNEEFESIAMLLFDIDRFKELNDTYGHEVGDKALKKAASALKNAFRSDDFVCRIGGDEFAVIMVNADPSMKALIAGKIEHIFEIVSSGDDGVPAFSMSVGVAFSGSLLEGEDIYKSADAALYRVKEAGRGDFEFYR